IKIYVMENITAILNDLIRINHDRVVGYEKAIDELKDEDADLKTLFTRYITESRQYAQELTTEVTRLGADPADGTTNSGKIYRVWMDLKAAIMGKDRKAILDNCEFGEDAAQKAYDMALNADVDYDPSLRDLIVRQKASLKAGHDEVKRLRDMHAASK
ncbi:MAG TPA: PA2169 family four-helix-bundle protein, partial [Flavisolibacter sp.]|nr:PA2169 family four-helix-bundle protein [Flavisolibacter sp.]